MAPTTRIIESNVPTELCWPGTGGTPMAKVPIYISFDCDHGSDLKILLVGQSHIPDSPFEIADYSIKDASPDWKAKARVRIRRVQQVIVICGQYTETATGVNVEIGIAREENKPYFLLAGRAIGHNKRPTAALRSDQLYKWTWPNLKSLIAGRR